MKKLSQTAICCILSLLILLIAEIMALAVNLVLALMRFPGFLCVIVFAVICPLFTYYGVKLTIAKSYSIDLQEMEFKNFSLNPIWVGIAFVLPVVILISAFIFIGGNENEYPYLTTVLASSMSFYMMSAVIAEEMIFRCVIMGIIRKNYNIKSAVIVSSVIYSIVNIITSANSLDSHTVLPVFITGIMSGLMSALIIIESGNFWNGVLIHISLIGVVIGSVIMGIDINDSVSNIKLSVISAILYTIVSIIAFIMIKKERKFNT